MKDDKNQKEKIQNKLPIDDKAHIKYRRNLMAFRDLPIPLVEKELNIRTRVENRCDWQDWKLRDEDPYSGIIYYDSWDYRLQENLKKPTAGYSQHVQRLGLGVYEPDAYGGVHMWRALCVGSDQNRYTDLKLVAWNKTRDGWYFYHQYVWITSSWFKDLLLETGLGDAEKQLINEEKKEYKYVITKNNFKLLQNQVSSLEKENKALKARVWELANDISSLKVAITKGGNK